MEETDGWTAFTELPNSGLAQVIVDSENGGSRVTKSSEASGVGVSPAALVFDGVVQNGHESLTKWLDSDSRNSNIPVLCSNEGSPIKDDYDDAGIDDAHNRSHESIESQRTIIEADDFANFLAQDDDEEVDDFKDEDVDFGVSEGEHGGVDLTLLMKSGSNAYMLDFTAGLLADSEVEGAEDYENDDDTLSDNEEDSHQDVPGRKDRSIKTSSWVAQTASIHHSENEQDEEKKAQEDEEFESPPRNLREEINNNVSKFSRVAATSGPGLFPHSSVVQSDVGSYSNVSSNSGTGLPGSSKYFIQSGSTPPSSPVTFKPQTRMKGPQIFPASAFEPSHSQELPHGFDPNSQSSPKLRRNVQEKFNDHEQNQNYMAQFDISSVYPTSPVINPCVTNSSYHSSIDSRSSPGSMPPQLQAYTFETPHEHSAFFSSSMENLSPSYTGDHSSPHVPNLLDSYTWESSPLQRGKSLPNIASLFSGAYPELCKNCGFSRNDYLFKIRLLQTQLEKTEKELKKKEKQWAGDLGELRRDNDRMQKVINQSLTLGPEARIEATMQHEITRLTSENLDLRESIDKQTDQIRKLKKMLKVYARKLKDGEAAEIAAELENEEKAANSDGIATVIHRERSYMGMLEYKKDDEAALIKNLILDLKPKVAAGLIPGLPAYILFMCVRHTDYINDDDKVKSLLTATINGIRKVVKRHSDDLERITMWLANTCRLLHTLKQYSGEKQFQTENTSKQNEQSLRNFDLSEYRQVFSDLAVWNYQALIKLTEELIQPNIVPAILEHEAIAGLTASKPSGLRGRSSSNAREMEDGKDSQHSLDALVRALNSYMRIVKQHAVDPELIKQIFRQLFYFLCAGALNNLLLRKDMCNWSKGMQIRYNLTHLEQWLRDNSLHEFGALAALEPIIQASQLLQARKTDSDVDSVCDMCSKLSTAQIVKILNIYTPVDEFEERVPVAFIRKIQAKLKQRDEQGTANTTLLMDTKYSYPVTFPFNPSSVALESISVPDQLHLGFLIRH